MENKSLEFEPQTVADMAINHCMMLLCSCSHCDYFVECDWLCPVQFIGKAGLFYISHMQKLFI